MKRLIKFGLLFMLVFSLVLTACGGGSSNNADGQEGSEGSTGETDESSSDKEIVIEYWSGPVWKNVEGVDSPEFGDWEKAKIAEFEDQNPNVTINFQSIPWDGIEEKTVVALAGGNPPDILVDSIDRRLMKYVEDGMNEPITDFIENELDDFNADMIESVSKDGEIYGIPVSMNPEYFYLNTALFKEKGLEHLIPTDDRMWTIDEMYDALKQVSGDGVYGTAMWAANEQGDEMNLMHFYARGAEQWSEDLSEIVLDQYPESVETLEMFLQMLDEGIMAPGPATTAALDGVELFKQNKVAMIPWGNNLWEMVEEGRNDGSTHPDVEMFGMAPPHAEGVTPKIASAFHGFQVFKQEDPEKREMIKKFVQFMVQPEHVKALAQSYDALPARESASYEFENPEMNAALEVVGELPLANTGVASPYYGDVRQMWYPELQAVLLGQKEPEQALKDYADKANALLAESQ